MLGGSGPVVVIKGRDGYHCLLWAFDLCVMQQPVMGVCISLLWAFFVTYNSQLWAFDLCVMQQPVMGICGGLFAAFDLCNVQKLVMGRILTFLHGW